MLVGRLLLAWFQTVQPQQNRLTPKKRRLIKLFLPNPGKITNPLYIIHLFASILTVT
jgi:hypothetical protein